MTATQLKLDLGVGDELTNKMGKYMVYCPLETVGHML